MALDKSVSLGGKINGETYATIAEAVVKKSLNDKKEPFNGLTTSKIRSIYALIMNVYTKINTPEDFDAHKSDLQYVKVKMAYESGRDSSREKPVSTFIHSTALMDAIDCIKTYDQFILYCRYAESLVAYFKFYGGKDK